MIYETYPITMAGSLPYAKLTVYIQEYFEEIVLGDRPLVLICPGGGYEWTSDREAEPLAMAFLAMGYHAAVLRYSCAPAVFPTALTELAYSVRLIRQKAKEWHVNPKQIIVLGCSAGGHLAASLGVFWERDFLAASFGVQGDERRIFRPDGMILCYPVITSGEYAHRGSFDHLLGGQEAALSERFGVPALELVSMEKQVNEGTPPAFLWHTFTDNAVPVENSLLFVGALRRAGVSAEFHMYPCGGHGLSLANRLTLDRSRTAIQEECTSWISLVHTWIEHQYVKGS